MEGDPLPRRSMGIAIAALLPWAWFALRDQLGPVTDVLAIVLPMLTLVIAIAVGVLGRRRPAAVAFAVSTLLVGIVATVVPWIPHGTGTVDPSRSVRIAEANIGDGELEGADTFIKLNADVLVVSEIGPPLTDRLSQNYKYVASYWNGPAIAVFSRWPLTVLERPGPDLPGFLLRVHAPSGDFDLIAVHIPRPWWTAGGSTYRQRNPGQPYQTTAGGHHRLVEQIAERVAKVSGPLVIAGDLNTTDRGRDYRILTRQLHDAMLDSWGRPSQIGRWASLLVRIDHVLVKPGWCSDNNQYYSIPRSDHHGLMTTIGPCR